QVAVARHGGEGNQGAGRLEGVAGIHGAGTIRAAASWRWRTVANPAPPLIPRRLAPTAVPPHVMLVELSHVDLAFGGPPLLEDAGVVIDRGARFALIGRNGCGKSSLMKLLAGEIAPDDGERRAMEGIRIGYLPQEGDMAPFAGSALEAALTAGGAGETATGKMLDRLGVDPAAPFAALSGGLRRRTALARALA